MNIIETVANALSREREVFSIGKSVCGNDILCAHRGGRGAQVIITAAIHARECYSALVALRQLREFKGVADGGAYFIPLVNPDGALFFQTGDAQGSGFLAEHAELHKQWKANADGVDLNCNFDANWGTGKLNKRIAGASDYIGGYPLCAPETRALADLTNRVRPRATVSYHCMGAELYWQFFQDEKRAKRDERLASAIARHVGVTKVDGDLGSAGGYKDYCVQKLKIPAVTIELIAHGEHPFGAEAFLPDIERNKDLPEFILKLLGETEQLHER